MEDKKTPVTEPRSQNEGSCCAPGCGCGSSGGGSGIRIAVSLLVLALVAGIVLYRTIGAKPPATDGPAVSSATTAPSTAGMEAMRASAAKGRIGEEIGSLKELDSVASGMEAAFVYIPGGRDEAIPQQAVAAVVGAQQAFFRNAMTLGLYTLRFDCADRAALSQQAAMPAMMVRTGAQKAALVSGELTESRLLQAYMALARSAGCCPSSSGSTSCP